MKLWMLFILHNAIAGSVGPLPYDQAECLARGEDMKAEFHKTQAANINTPGVAEAGDLTVVCVELSEKPVLGSPWPKE